MNGRPNPKPRRTHMPAADSPMVVASAALHEMFLSLRAGGFTEGQALAFTAHYLAACQGTTGGPGLSDDATGGEG